MRIGLIVPRTKLWWASLALLTHPETAGARIRWVPTLAEAQRLHGSDRVLLSTDVLDADADADAYDLDGFDDARLILWDGVRSLQEMPERAAETTQHWPSHHVGDIAGHPFPFRQSALLFHQDESRYARFRRTLLQPATVSQLPPGNRLFLQARSLLLTAKHARQIPADLVSDRAALIFAGQSGRITLERFVTPDTPRLRGLIEALQRFEAGRVEPPTSLGDVAEEFADVVSGLPFWDHYVAVSCLARAFHLISLRASGLPCEFRFHPAPNVNYYQSLLRRRAVYLDFGGANGDEEIYPRTADLLVLGKQQLTVRPPEHWSTCSAQELMERIALQSQELLATARERLGTASSVSSVVRARTI